MTGESRQIAAIILAAGKGTRMKSELPKVLHPICGTPLVSRVVMALSKCSIDQFCLVLGGNLANFDFLIDQNPSITCVSQKNRLGTGDAVAAAGVGFNNVELPSFTAGEFYRGEKISSDYVMITAGDTPALSPAILNEFIQDSLAKNARLAVLGMRHPTPFGYGRLILKDGVLDRIVEEKDANADEKKVNLCNSGVIFAETKFLFSCLGQTNNQNAQSEYYLTDCFEVARSMGEPASVFETSHFRSFDGVNNRIQLAELETWLQSEKKKLLMTEGVTFNLVESCYVDDTVKIGPDTTVGPNCSLLGHTTIGKNCVIGANSVLSNCNIPDGTLVKIGSVLEN